VSDAHDFGALVIRQLLPDGRFGEERLPSDIAGNANSSGTCRTCTAFSRRRSAEVIAATLLLLAVIAAFEDGPMSFLRSHPATSERVGILLSFAY